MRKIFLLLLSVLLFKTVFSQTDSAILIYAGKSRIANVADEPIYNGREHIGYHHAIEGTPYFQSSAWQKGTVVYQEVLYKNVFLKYDLVADELIVRHLNGYTGVILFTPRINFFTLGDKNFINISGDNETSLKPGFYQEVIRGNMSLYARRSKFLKETIVSDVLERKFVNNHSFYLMKDGKYYPIRKEKDILNLVNDKKSINAWMKESGLKFKLDPEAALIKIIDYNNKLSS